MGTEADGQHGRQHRGDCRPRRGEEGSGVHGGARLHLQVRVWRCGSAASKRHSRARGEDGKGGEDGEEGEEWKAGRGERRGLEDREQREDGGLVVPADDHVPCLLLGRDRMLPFHLGGHLALVHATCPSDLHGRSIDASMAGWMDPTDGRRPVAKPTTDHSTVPWPNARGPVQSPSSDAREQTTYLRQLYHSVVRDVKCPGSLPAVLQPARHVRPSTVRQHATQRAEDRVGDPTTWVRTIFPNSLSPKSPPGFGPSSPRGLD